MKGARRGASRSEVMARGRSCTQRHSAAGSPGGGGGGAFSRSRSGSDGGDGVANRSPASRSAELRSHVRTPAPPKHAPLRLCVDEASNEPPSVLQSRC